jgi:phosphoserine aminotransferase
MWAMMGERPIDVVHHESFGKAWFSDIKSHLKLTDVNEITAPYGQLPDLAKTNKVEGDAP